VNSSLARQLESKSAMANKRLFAVGDPVLHAPVPSIALSIERMGQMIHMAQSHGYRQIEPLESDLLKIAAGIAFADRSQQRPGNGPRRISLVCGVDALDTWKNPFVQARLSRCLNTLTAERWEIDFQQPIPHAASRQTNLQLPLKICGPVIPYSDGLDSLLTHRWVSAVAGEPPLSVTVLTRPGLAKRIRNSGEPDPWVSVVLRLGVGNHAETSFRSRAFLFLSVAAVLCRLRGGSSSILVPETGQGAVGSSLTPIDEHIAYGQHPHFTRQFSDFLDALWPRQATAIKHPNLWLTKAQLVSSAIETVPRRPELEAAIIHSRSCTNRKLLPDIPDLACGICANCLMRRVALVSAGLEHLLEQEQYVLGNLKASDLSSSISADLPKFPVTARHMEIARGAVIVHRDLALLARQGSSGAINRQAHLIANAQDLQVADVLPQLHQLLQRHDDDWHQFLERATTTGSWVRRICGQ
jgi:7-cyano-7-deazaguanine synthase in queuosine biosynthesis